MSGCFTCGNASPGLNRNPEGMMNGFLLHKNIRLDITIRRIMRKLEDIQKVWEAGVFVSTPMPPVPVLLHVIHPGTVLPANISTVNE